MNNNDIFKRILQLTGLSLKKELVVHIFALANIQTTELAIKSWRTPMSNQRANRLPDVVLSGFLDGLFKYRDIQSKNGLAVFQFDDVGAQKCERCGHIVLFIDDGETCPECKLVQ